MASQDLSGIDQIWTSADCMYVGSGLVCSSLFCENQLARECVKMK